MKIFRHVLYIILLTIILIFIIPDGVITIITNHIQIHGDGEEAMNEVGFINLLIRLSISAGLSLMFFYLVNRHIRNKRRRKPIHR